MSDVQRKIAIGINNETGVAMESPTTYFDSGTSDTPLPYTIPNGTAGLIGARKTAGPVATGALICFLLLSREAQNSFVFYRKRWCVGLQTGRKNALCDVECSI